MDRKVKVKVLDSQERNFDLYEEIHMTANRKSSRQLGRLIQMQNIYFVIPVTIALKSDSRAIR